VCHDPYRIDSADGDSLSATLVIKTKKYFRQYGHDEIVAVYYSRPSQGRDVVNQELLKIAMYYNAKVHFENNVGNVKEYFEKMKKLSMLAKSPTTILSKKASFEQGEQTNKGISISNQHIKMEALSYVRD
jgi:hypothetical protein